MASEQQLFQSQYDRPVWANPFGFYYNAFGYRLSAVWGLTPFADEILDISFQMALSCWLQDNVLTEYHRRLLLYYYLRPYFQTTEAENSLNYRFTILPTDNTYLKRVIHNLCILYDTPPVRQVLYKGKPLSAKDQEWFNELLDEVNYNDFMGSLYEAVKLTNDMIVSAVIVPDEDSDEKCVQLRMFYNNKARIKYDDFGNMQQVWIHHEHLIGDINKQDQYFLDRFWVWDKNKLILKTMDNKQIPFPYMVGGQEKQVNEVNNIYGRIPFVECQLDNITDGTENVTGGALWELVRAQLDANKLDRGADEIVMLEGFPVHGLVNMGFEKGESISLGPGTIMTKDVEPNSENPQQPYTFTIGESSAYNEIDGYKLKRMKQAMKNYGLPQTIVDDMARLPDSGVALKEVRKELLEQRQKDLGRMKHIECEIFELLLTIVTQDPASPHYGKISMDDLDNYEVQTTFGEIDTSMQFPDLKLIYDTLLENDYISPLEHYQRLTDDTSIQSEDELLTKMKNNKAFKDKLKGLLNDGGTNTIEPSAGGIGKSGNGIGTSTEGAQAIDGQDTGNGQQNNENNQDVKQNEGQVNG